MAIHVIGEFDGAIKRFDDMLQKLQVVPIPAELHAWQVEDMKRQYPETEINNPTSAMTRIYPRSRRMSEFRENQLKKLRGARPTPRPRKPVRITKRAAGRRPILRPELMNRLRQRMMVVMRDNLKW